MISLKVEMGQKYYLRWVFWRRGAVKSLLIYNLLLAHRPYRVEAFNSVRNASMKRNHSIESLSIWAMRKECILLMIL